MERVFVVIAIAHVTACATHAQARRDRLPEPGQALVLLRANLSVSEFPVAWSDSFLGANHAGLRVRRDDGKEFLGAVAKDNIVALELPPGTYAVTEVDKPFFQNLEHPSVRLEQPLTFRVAPGDQVVYAGAVLANLPSLRGTSPYDLTEDCYGFDLAYFQRQLSGLPWSQITVAKGLIAATRRCSMDAGPSR